MFSWVVGIVTKTIALSTSTTPRRSHAGFAPAKVAHARQLLANSHGLKLTAWWTLATSELATRPRSTTPLYRTRHSVRTVRGLNV